jgi:hypothetical protein
MFVMRHQLVKYIWEFMNNLIKMKCLDLCVLKLNSSENELAVSYRVFSRIKANSQGFVFGCYIHFEHHCYRCIFKLLRYCKWFWCSFICSCNQFKITNFYWRNICVFWLIQAQYVLKVKEHFQTTLEFCHVQRLWVA